MNQRRGSGGDELTLVCGVMAFSTDSRSLVSTYVNVMPLFSAIISRNRPTVPPYKPFMATTLSPEARDNQWKVARDQ